MASFVLFFFFFFFFFCSTLCGLCPLLVSGRSAAPSSPSSSPPSPSLAVLERNCANVSCPERFGYDNYIVAFLNARPGRPAAELRASARRAIAIAREFGDVASEVDFLHSTVSYMCCLGLEDYLRAIEIIRRWKWAPFSVGFAHAAPQHDLFSPSFRVMADDATQTEMERFVRALEDELILGGVPVRRRRSAQEAFHVTLGAVLPDFPLERAVAAINSAMPGPWSSAPVPCDSMTLLLPPGPWEFYAANDTRAAR